MSGELDTPGMPRRLTRLAQMLRQDAHRLVTTGVPHLFVALALTQGINILRRILLARVFSVAELGQLSYVMQIADLVAVVADLGICTAVLKYAAEPGSDEQRRRYYCHGLLLGSLAASGVALVYVAAILVLGLGGDTAIRVFLLMVAPYIPIAAIVKTPLVFMQARREIKRAARFTAITQALSLIMLVGAAKWFGLWGFFVTVTVAPLSNLAILLLALRRELRWYWPSWPMLKKMSSFGFVSMLANVAGFADGAVAVVLLRYLTASDATVGLYAVALMVMTGIRLLPASLMQTAFPYLSGLLTDPRRLRVRMLELSLKQALIMSGIAAVWYLTGAWLIDVVFGAKYAGAFRPSTILLLALIPVGFSAPAGQALLAMGRVPVNLAIAVVQLGVNVAAGFALIPRYGMMGAAGAAGLAQLIGGGFSMCAALFVLTSRRPPAAAARAPQNGEA